MSSDAARDALYFTIALIVPYACRAVLNAILSAVTAPLKDFGLRCIRPGGKDHVIGPIVLDDNAVSELLAAMEFPPAGVVEFAPTVTQDVVLRGKCSRTRIPRGAVIIAPRLVSVGGDGQGGLPLAMHSSETTSRSMLQVGKTVNFFVEAVQTHGLESLPFPEARNRLGLGKSGAYLLVGMRLVLWHWLQPFMFAWSLLALYGELDALQQWLALAVMAREIGYFVLAAAVALFRPSVMLSDPASNGLWGFGMFVSAPEKYLIMSSDICGAGDCCTCLDGLVHPPIGLVALIPFMLGDISAAAAMVLAFLRKTAFGPLMVSYGITAASMVAGMCYWLYVGCLCCIQDALLP